MTHLCILDKDGTLTRPKSGERFVQSPLDQMMIPGVLERLQQLEAERQWSLAIATNQGGVASGYKSLDDAVEETFFAMRLTNIPLSMIAYSYEKNGGEALLLHKTKLQGESSIMQYSEDYKFRKPARGMLTRLAAVSLPGDGSDCQWERKIFIGDRPEDEGAAQAAGFEFLWAKDWLKNGIPAAR